MFYSIFLFFNFIRRRWEFLYNVIKKVFSFFPNKIYCFYFKTIDNLIVEYNNYFKFHIIDIKKIFNKDNIEINVNDFKIFSVKNNKFLNINYDESIISNNTIVFFVNEDVLKNDNYIILNKKINIKLILNSVYRKFKIQNNNLNNSEYLNVINYLLKSNIPNVFFLEMHHSLFKNHLKLFLNY